MPTRRKGILGWIGTKNVNHAPYYQAYVFRFDGTDWNQFLGLAGHVHIQALDFYGPFLGWLVGSSCNVASTTDGGLTWNKATIPGGPADVLGVKMMDPTNVWAVGGSTHSGFIGFFDGTTPPGWEQQWPKDQPAPAGLKAAPAGLKAVDFVDTSKGWAAGWYGQILFTDTGGMRWDPQASGLADTITAIQFVSDQQGWAVTDSGLILHTNPDGKSWDPNPQYPNKGEKPVALYGLAMLDESNGWAVGAGGLILHFDGAKNQWERQKVDGPRGKRGPLPDFNAVDCIDKSTAWAVGTGGVIAHTSDGGQNPWKTQVHPIELPDRNKTKVTCDLTCIKMIQIT
jgi:photosystem II stability/assembly factor-like uncharacterized protein